VADLAVVAALLLNQGGFFRRRIARFRLWDDAIVILPDFLLVSGTEGVKLLATLKHRQVVRVTLGLFLSMSHVHSSALNLRALR